jgi:hypothetical protein
VETDYYIRLHPWRLTSRLSNANSRYFRVYLDRAICESVRAGGSGADVYSGAGMSLGSRSRNAFRRCCSSDIRIGSRVHRQRYTNVRLISWGRRGGRSRLGKPEQTEETEALLVPLIFMRSDRLFDSRYCFSFES